MSAKQDNRNNRIDIKRVAVYALLVAICLIVGYLENYLSISLAAIIPGVKIGLSNAIVLTLIFCGDTKGAWMVNITRICLSALIFGSPISFLFSLSGGIASMITASVLSRFKSVSAIGTSIAGGAMHNIFQCFAAMIFVGVGVVKILPFLILLGAICGAFCGVLLSLILKKLKTSKVF
ncbi:MAG: Gx transporter family protein [Clostridia bacterium]|nr:Gx transporter family protein [Clostridia bacterium]